MLRCLVTAVVLLTGCRATVAAGVTPSSPAPRRVWLEPARVFGPDVYFSEELVPIAEAVASTLQSAGFQVIPPAETRAQWAAIQQGVLPGRAQRCEAPPPPSRLSEVLYAGALRGEIDVRCEAQRCELIVRVMEPATSENDDEREVVRYGKGLRAGDSPVQWARVIASTALDKLPAPKPEGGLGIGGLLSPGQRPGTYAIVHNATHSGPWTDKLTSATFQPHAEALKACSPPSARWRDWWGQQFVIELQPSGKVSRCEYELPDHLPPPGFACECALLRTLDFGPAPSPRRASFYLDIATLQETAGPARGMPRRAYLWERQSTDRSATLGTREVDDAALTGCLEAIEARLGEVDVPVLFDVGADGMATGYQAQWAPALSEPVRACLGAELGRAWFNCPLSGRAQVKARLHLEVGDR